MAHGREAHDCKHVVATELLDLLLWHDLLWHYLLWHYLLWHYLLWQWTCCKSTSQTRRPLALRPRRAGNITPTECGCRPQGWCSFDPSPVGSISGNQ